MALRFVDGFDSYVTADMTKKWTGKQTFVVIAASVGRRSTSAMECTSTSTYASLTLGAQAIWIIGFAFSFATVPGGDAPILNFRDEGAGNTQVDFCVTGAQTLRARRAGTTTLGTTTATLAQNTYYYLEIRIRFHATLGEIELRINGVVALTLTGINTISSANAYADALRLGNTFTTAAGTTRYDDLYICDDTGSAPHNTFLGDCRVDTLLPNADGTSQQWTPSTPGTHYTLVDDAAPNTTDYVSSATIGHRDTYGMQDLAASTGTIYGVQLNLAAHKEDAGARLLKPLILSGASEALGASVGMPTSQLYYRHVQTTDPATAAAWTEAGVNAAQCGAEVA